MKKPIHICQACWDKGVKADHITLGACENCGWPNGETTMKGRLYEDAFRRAINRHIEIFWNSLPNANKKENT